MAIVEFYGNDFARNMTYIGRRLSNRNTELNEPKKSNTVLGETPNSQDFFFVNDCHKMKTSPQQIS